MYESSVDEERVRKSTETPRGYLCAYFREVLFLVADDEDVLFMVDTDDGATDGLVALCVGIQGSVKSLG